MTPTEHDRRIADKAWAEINYWVGDKLAGRPTKPFTPTDIILTAIAEAKKPLEDDAARYRYLRLVWEEWTGTSWTGDSNDVASKLDAAIDATRAQEGKS